jgi:hypothetical protein
VTLTRESGSVLIRPRLLPDNEQIASCLGEIDRVLFKVADHEDCRRFHVDSQLTAVVMLLLRCSSLLRSVLTLFRSGETDGFQVVLRAFEETWYLAFYFRFGENGTKASEWLAEKGDSRSVPLGRLIAFAKERGAPDPTMGRDYGRLSEVSHPTKSAAMNSVTLCGERLGIEGADTELVEERRNEAARLPDALYRLVWVLIDQDKRFIPLHVQRQDLPLCWKFCDVDKHLESA